MYEYDATSSVAEHCPDTQVAGIFIASFASDSRYLEVPIFQHMLGMSKILHGYTTGVSWDKNLFVLGIGDFVDQKPKKKNKNCT